jgi:Cu(I)/Ag(I) efflux system membrane fusion protein
MKKIKQVLLNFWNSTYRWPFIIVVILAFLIGYISKVGPSIDHASHKHTESVKQETGKIEMWTCSMHPQIKQPNPGKCPICGMDLVPVKKSDSDEQGEWELKLSERAIKLASIQTAPAERRYVAAEIRLVGKVVYDETRLKYITAWVPGRIDRLYVDYTGIQVRKGDHLASLYSPQLITAQQELIEAKKFPYKNIEAVREKLRLWGLTKKQIKEIEMQGRTKDHLTIYSPIGGVVVHKNAIEGMYVKTGTRIYTIADLTTIWVKLDVYESDLPWIRYGQTVEFETEAYPGDKFTGKIAFIDPVLNQKTRTVKVRLNVLNSDGRLKPEMFVRAIVRSKLSATGKVMDEDLMGKWISPMHPEIIKDGPGKCDICGMPVVKAEELGYLKKSQEDKEKPLIIPASAPLLTGTRAIVYVELPDKKGSYEGREIILGPRAGDYYTVKEGLREGELVVVNGAFKIDSDLQIQAKPSMMNPEGGVSAPVHQHGSTTKPRHQEDPSKKQKHDSHETSKQKSIDIPILFKKSIDVMVGSYFNVQHALSSDNFLEAKNSAKKLLTKLAQVDMNLLKGKAHIEWMKLESRIKESSQKLMKAADIEAARVQFELLTTAVTNTIKTLGSGGTAIYRFHCPMAFNNKGAFWLQKNSETRNPYFGNSMLTCKDSVETLVPADKKKK